MTSRNNNYFSLQHFYFFSTCSFVG